MLSYISACIDICICVSTRIHTHSCSELLGFPHHLEFCQKTAATKAWPFRSIPPRLIAAVNSRIAVVNSRMISQISSGRRDQEYGWQVPNERAVGEYEACR